MLQWNNTEANALVIKDIFPKNWKWLVGVKESQDQRKYYIKNEPKQNEEHFYSICGELIDYAINNPDIIRLDLSTSELCRYKLRHGECESIVFYHKNGYEFFIYDSINKPTHSGMLVMSYVYEFFKGPFPHDIEVIFSTKVREDTTFRLTKNNMNSLAKHLTEEQLAFLCLNGIKI